MLVTIILLVILGGLLLSIVMMLIDLFLWKRFGPDRLTPVELKLFQGLLALQSTKIWAAGIREWQKSPSTKKFFELLRALRQQAKDDAYIMSDILGEELTALLFHPTLKINGK